MPRRTAFRIREQVERGRRLDVALDACIDGLDDRDRAFAHELVYGVTRLRGRLDHLLSRQVHRGLESLDARLLEVLRLGAYQLLYMGSVPGYAAVSESVEHAGSLAGKGAAGLANAVLRRVGESGDGRDLFPLASSDPAGFLATWGSHPRWLIDRWLDRWTAEEVRELVELNNTRPGLYLAPLRMAASEASKRLSAAGLESAPVGFDTECIRMGPGSNPVAALDALPDAIVQDPAANLVARYADVAAGTKVADLCAAPGGKALAVSTRAAYTLAADRSESRIRMVRENAQRTGSDVGCIVADARHPPVVSADVVMLDVPCTGTGTFARRPDARWRLTPESLTELATVQRDLLRSAADLIPLGGLLVYSTCSLEPEENVEQVEAFLAERGDFMLDPTDAIDPVHLDARGHLVLNPQDTGFDGSFAARMRRAG